MANFGIILQLQNFRPFVLFNPAPPPLKNSVFEQFLSSKIPNGKFWNNFTITIVLGPKTSF